jgi:hypothetical protein
MDQATRTQIETLQNTIIDYHLAESFDAYDVLTMADMKASSESAQYTLKIQYGITNANHIYWD